jgi:hypothetical protein
MLKNMLAVALILAMTHSLSAQSDDFSNDLGKLFEEHAVAFAKCSENYDSVDCQNENSLTRRLIDSGWCRKRGQDHLFQRCSVYRSYIIYANLNGYQFGFEEDSFSTDFSSMTPTLAGTFEKQTTGKLHIKCAAGRQPLVIVELEKEYPNFAIRSDFVNFLAVIEGEKNTPMARAILSEENSKGIFFTASSEIAIRILEYYSRNLTEISGDDVALTFNSYDPKVTLELSLASLLLASLDALKHRSELLEHVNALLTRCKTPM